LIESFEAERFTRSNVFNGSSCQEAFVLPRRMACERLFT